MTRSLILTLSLLAGLAAAATAADPMPRVKLATLAPKGTSYHQILLAMGEQWRQAPGGGVSLTIYTDGTMGGEADMVRRLRVGQLQAAMLTVTGLSEIDKSVRALQNMPMMFRSLDEVDYIREKLRPAIEKKFSDKGFIVLFWGDAGWVRFFSRRPVLYPDDLKKLKMFAWAGDNDAVDIMKALGFQPVPLEPTDMLTSLETGLIDAVASTPFYALASQLYGPAPYMLELNYAPLVGGTIITKKAWESFPPATRAALLKAAAEAGDQVKRRGRVESDEAVAAMKKRGLKVQAVSPEVEAVWRKLAESIYPRIRGPIVPAAMFDEVQRLLAEYRTAKPAVQP